MPPFSRLDYRQGCQDLTVKAIQSTQRMWWSPLAAHFALVQPPLYKSDDWDKAFPKALVNLITKDGNTYAVFAGIHPGNVLWYNKKLLSRRLKENMFMRTLFLRIKRASLKEYCPPSPVFL
jgi:hypothetical protein